MGGNIIICRGGGGAHGGAHGREHYNMNKGLTSNKSNTIYSEIMDCSAQFCLTAKPQLDCIRAKLA